MEKQKTTVEEMNVRVDKGHEEVCKALEALAKSLGAYGFSGTAKLRLEVNLTNYGNEGVSTAREISVMSAATCRRSGLPEAVSRQAPEPRAA